MGLFSIFNTHINDNEIKFLKYLDKKPTSITFSPRWKGENIEPEIETKKLLKLGYIDIKDSKYILSDKGKNKIDDNIHLFLSDRDKANEIYKDLTNSEYRQLQVFNKLDRYSELKLGNLSYDKGYTKYDILWSIYNDVILENVTKDFVVCSIAYHRMAEQVYREKRYDYALKLLITSLYYHIKDFYNYDISLYERHVKKLHPILTKYINSCQLYFSNIDELSIYFNNAVKRYIPNKQSKIINLLINNYWEDYKNNVIIK